MILGLGIDIIEIERIKNAVEKWGDSFLNRIFHKEEIEYAKKHILPYQHYAARFAVKEAVYKALGQRELTWKDLKVINQQDGKPVCECDKLPEGTKLLISISHSKHYAIANAIITKE